MATATSTENYGGAESSESEALKLSFNYLEKSIDTDSILPNALGRSLISERQRSECASEPDPYKKAEKFLGHLQRAVNGDSNKYHIFVQVLRESSHDHIALRLQRTYDDLAQKITSGIKQSSETPLSPTMSSNAVEPFTRNVAFEGEVRQLQDNLSPDKNDCEIPCSFGCGRSVSMNEMKHHKRYKCVKRPTTCGYCGYHDTHDIITENHYPVCLQFPKKQLNQALAITPSPTTVNPQYLYNQQPVVFTITDYHERKQANKVLISPPFYTHAQGYKFCLKVYPNGNDSGKGTHISVSAHLMRGEYDDELEWPFQGCVVFKLLNWRAGGKSHVSKSIDLNKEIDPDGTRTSRVKDKEIAEAGYSFSRFISHTKLDYNPTTDTEYLQDDYLKMELSVVHYSTALLHKTPSWQKPSTTTQSGCEFTLTEFSKRKQFNNRYFSPPFYTHQRGYKMYLEVYANGQSSGENTHISIFATLTRGEHDQNLQWPFTGEMIIELLNWREDNEHYRETLSIKFTTERKCHGEKYQLYKFISHSSIDPKYLLDDCLRLRVSVVMYDTALLHKTPSWQDPLTTTQSVCEFTLTDFKRRKKLNNRYYSKGFYTHPQGYKLCLEVCANGKRHGEKSHISLFAYLMKGAYDDDLQWPFEGTIIIQLLNWRDDKRHHEKNISFNRHTDPGGTICGRVKEGKYTTDSWGRYQFIAHSSLRYNITTNTEYLQENCLRLRVKEVVFYSTALLHKTPPWQDPLTTTQSVCEFTLTEFSKRKHFGNEYASPPFYTHPGGYKMILFVIANGDQKAEGTHISVRPRLMKGENDEDLAWPYEGCVIVELLNWREDKDHHMGYVEFNCDTDPDASCSARVTQGHLAEKALYGRYDEFISHSSLQYNPTTNVEYLQEDCLRFRVKCSKL